MDASSSCWPTPATRCSCRGRAIRCSITWRSLEQVTARPYDLDPDARWRIDFASLRGRAHAAHARDSGRLAQQSDRLVRQSGDEVERLADFAARRDLALIADEVFADYELAPGRAAHGRPRRGRTDVLAFLARRSVEIGRACLR